MYRIFLVISVVLGFSMLSSCSQYLNQQSNSAMNANAQSSKPNQICNKWCHNGWCSEHCEDVVGAN